jgi:hypothetical protein
MFILSTSKAPKLYPKNLENRIFGMSESSLASTTECKTNQLAIVIDWGFGQAQQPIFHVLWVYIDLRQLSIRFSWVPLK